MLMAITSHMTSLFSLTGRPVHLITVLVLLLAQPVWAEKPAEKVLIDADHMKLNMESGKSVYSGHVRIAQGELVLTGDKVTLEQKNNVIQRISVIGRPARYHHVTETGEAITAESRNMVYSASANTLVLTGNASLKQPENTVSSEKITYDTIKRIIIAGDTETLTTQAGKPDDKNKQRVTITLTPGKKTLSNNQAPDGGTPQAE
jgi:lipopolysaccharide export system protein LptA